jgi:hypothetical protein
MASLKFLANLPLVEPLATLAYPPKNDQLQASLLQGLKGVTLALPGHYNVIKQ